MDVRKMQGGWEDVGRMGGCKDGNKDVRRI